MINVFFFFLFSSKLLFIRFSLCIISGAPAAQKPTLDVAKNLAMVAVEILCVPQFNIPEIKKYFEEDMKKEQN